MLEGAGSVAVALARVCSTHQSDGFLFAAWIRWSRRMSERVLEGRDEAGLGDHPAVVSRECTRQDACRERRMIGAR